MGKYGEGLPLALHQPCSPGFLSRQPMVKWASGPAFFLCQNIARAQGPGCVFVCSPTWGHLGLLVAVTLPYHRAVLLSCPHFSLFSQLALLHGPTPSWVTSQLVLTAFFPMHLEHSQPCRPRPALVGGGGSAVVFLCSLPCLRVMWVFFG